MTDTVREQLARGEAAERSVQRLISLELSLRVQIAGRDAENERLRAALKPFADWIEKRDANPTTSSYPDSCPLIYYPEGINEGAATVGDLRRARRAVEQKRAVPKEAISASSKPAQR